MKAQTTKRARRILRARARRQKSRFEDGQYPQTIYFNPDAEPLTPENLEMCIEGLKQLRDLAAASGGRLHFSDEDEARLRRVVGGLRAHVPNYIDWRAHMNLEYSSPEDEATGRAAFQLGYEDCLALPFSSEAIEVLRQNLACNSMNWLDTEDGELSDRFRQVMSGYDRELPPSFVYGFWSGVLTVGDFFKRIPIAREAQVNSANNGNK